MGWCTSNLSSRASKLSGTSKVGSGCKYQTLLTQTQLELELPSESHSGLGRFCPLPRPLPKSYRHPWTCPTTTCTLTAKLYAQPRSLVRSICAVVLLSPLPLPTMSSDEIRLKAGTSPWSERRLFLTRWPHAEFSRLCQNAVQLPRCNIGTFSPLRYLVLVPTE